MAIDYANTMVIKKIAEEIESRDNVERKAESLKQYEIYNDRMLPYVKAFLRTFYKESDIDGLPIMSSINLARRIVNQEASIYKNAPKRVFVGVTEEQSDALHDIYEQMYLDAYLLKSNQYYKLQQQNNIQIILVNGEFKVRVLLNHNFDVVPDPLLPDLADAYILSGYDKSSLMPDPLEETDHANLLIADAQDFKAGETLRVLWSDDFNFLFDAKGVIIGDATPNPINIKPFVDVAACKDFEFFVRQGKSVTEFTVELNAALTDMSQIVRMQGFAQAYMIADETSMPTSIKIGPAIAVKMPLNPNSEQRPEFGFAQPNADIAGSMGYMESLIALFLTSRGLDPKLISGKGDGIKYSSGIERLLSMIDMFEPSRQDFSLYERVEQDIFEIIKAYINTYAGTEWLDYDISALPEESYVTVTFNGPEIIKTDKDRIELLKQKLDLRLMSPVEAIMQDRGIDEAEAVKIKQKIDSEFSVKPADVVANAGEKVTTA